MSERREASEGPAGPGRELPAAAREVRRYLEYSGVCLRQPDPAPDGRAPLGPGKVRSPACCEASVNLSQLEKLPPLVLLDRNSPETTQRTGEFQGLC